MGGMLSQPVTKKHLEQGEGNGLRYGLSCMQGWRREMEDAHDIKIGIDHGLDNWSFFAVFDGHAGKCAAIYAALNLLDYIVDENQDELKKPPNDRRPSDSDDICSFEESCLPESHEIWDKCFPLDDSEDAQEKSSTETSDSSSSNKVPSEHFNVEEEACKLESTKPCRTKTTTSSDDKNDIDLREGEESTKNTSSDTTVRGLSLEPATMEDTQASDSPLKTHTNSLEENANQVPADNVPTQSKNDRIITDDDDQSEKTKMTKRNNNSNKSDKRIESKFVESALANNLDEIKEYIKVAFLRIDNSFKNQVLDDMSGCTAVCALVSPTHIFIANCGDSRALLYSGDDHIRVVTDDHKPCHPIERTRIVKAGGTATSRINGTLAVSRALGDFEFKKNSDRGPLEQLVSPEPDITCVERIEKADKFLVLACDGIWDVMSNSELCKYVEYLLKLHEDLQEVCSNVIEACLRKGSRDNMSIIIVVFENGPKYDEEFVKLDLEKDKELLRFVDETMNLKPLISHKNMLGEIRENEKKLSDKLLPPGAEIDGKYKLITERFSRNYHYINSKLFPQTPHYHYPLGFHKRLEDEEKAAAKVTENAAAETPEEGAANASAFRQDDNDDDEDYEVGGSKKTKARSKVESDKPLDDDKLADN